MKALVCDVCGGTLQMDVGGITATCQYCGVQYTVERLREKIQVAGIATEENLLFRAQEFEKENDLKRAEEYYDRVLDLNPTHAIAKAGFKRVLAQKVEVNGVYEGIVTKIMSHGCFVKLLPSEKEGLVHISRLGNGRISNTVEDIVHIGDKIQVMVVDIDSKERIFLKHILKKG